MFSLMHFKVVKAIERLYANVMVATHKRYVNNVKVSHW